MSFDIGNFQPLPAATQTIAVNSGSQRVRVPATAIAAVWTAKAVWVRAVVVGSEAAFIEQGDATVTAAAASGMPVVPGEACYFRLWKGGYVAAIAAGTCTLYLTPGYL